MTQVIPMQDQNEPLVKSAAFSFENPGKRFALVTLGLGMALVQLEELEKNEMVKNRALKDYLIFENGMVIDGLDTSNGSLLPLPEEAKVGINLQIGFMEVMLARSSGLLN